MRGRLHTREDSGIRLDAEGRWWHDGEPVTHPRIIEAWNRGIERDERGRYILRFGKDWAVIAVDDAPIQVVGARPQADVFVLALSDGREETLDPSTLELAADGVLHCRVRGGEMPARFSRSAQFVVGEHLTEDRGSYKLTVAGRRYDVPVRKRS